MIKVASLTFDDGQVELARELHDAVAQGLTTMLVEMENFKAGQYGRRSVIEEIDSYQRETRAVLDGIRRVLFELRGESAATIDFVPMLRARVQQVTHRHGLPIRLLVSRRWPEQLSREAAKHLTRILEEALQNVRRHSGARQADVRLGMAKTDEAFLWVRDDGRGFTPGEVGGMGLRGMRERVLLLGGELQIKAAIPHGTIVRAVFPRERLV